MWNNLFFAMFRAMVVSLIFIMHVSAQTTNSNTDAIAAGADFSVVMKTNGDMWYTGNMHYIDPREHFATFTQPGMSIKAISCGYWHTMVLAEDGTVWNIFHNGYGQNGDGTDTNRNTWTQAPDVTGVIAISAGNLFNMVVKDDGTVWGAGRNNKGQLGNGETIEQQTTFVQATGIENVVAVACGEEHTIALKEDGTVWSTGSNNNGQLGIGSTTASNVFVEAIGLSDVKFIEAGYNFNMVLKEDGTMWGVGRRTNTNIYVELPISDVESIACGSLHALVVKTDGTVWGTGYNGYGALGDGTTQEQEEVFVQAIGLEDIQAVQAGEFHSMALKRDGTVWTAGRNQFGQIGDGTTDQAVTFLQATEGVDTTFGIPPPPKERLDLPFVFRNDPTQRAICRQITTKSACNGENACSWNVFLGMCNDHGHQPLFEGCHQCLFVSQGPSGNNGHWSADQGITLSDSDATRVVRWEGMADMETQDLASVDLVAPAGYEAYFAEPNSDTNSHPTYPAVEFRRDGDGNALISAAKHPSGCGDDWTWFVVVKPTQVSDRQNIFSTYDAPADLMDDQTSYRAFSISTTGLHWWATSPDLYPGDLTVNELQVVVYSSENNQILTINYYYQNGQPAMEYRNEDFPQGCGVEEDHGYVVMGRGVHNRWHNYDGLIYEATTYPRSMQNEEIREIAEALLAKYAE